MQSVNLKHPVLNFGRIKQMAAQYGAAVETTGFTRNLIHSAMKESEAEDRVFLEKWWDCQFKLQQLSPNNHRYPASIIRYASLHSQLHDMCSFLD